MYVGIGTSIECEETNGTCKRKREKVSWTCIWAFTSLNHLSFVSLHSRYRSGVISIRKGKRSWWKVIRESRAEQYFSTEINILQKRSFHGRRQNTISFVHCVFGVCTRIYRLRFCTFMCVSKTHFCCLAFTFAIAYRTLQFHVYMCDSRSHFCGLGFTFAMS